MTPSSEKAMSVDGQSLVDVICQDDGLALSNTARHVHSGLQMVIGRTA